MYLGLGKAGSPIGLESNGDGTENEDASARSANLTEKEKVVLDFHYYNYAFCKERRFDARATSTFLSIMKDILDEVTYLMMQQQYRTDPLSICFSLHHGMLDEGHRVVCNVNTSCSVNTKYRERTKI